MFGILSTVYIEATIRGSKMRAGRQRKLYRNMAFSLHRSTQYLQAQKRDRVFAMNKWLPNTILSITLIFTPLA